MLRRISRIERAARLVRQIAQDGVRLPYDGVAINKRRHLLHRVERRVFGRRGVVELLAVVLALVRQPEFLEHEDHFLHIAGCRPA